MQKKHAIEKKDKILNTADVILGIVLLAAGVFSGFAVHAIGDTGDSVLVEIDGKPYGTYSLHENREITIENNGRVNRFAIRNKEAVMVYADCPDQYCIRDGAISKTNQSIVCLPNRVVVSMPKSGSGEVDAISN